MSLTAAASLLDVLRTYQLLRPVQLDEIERELLPRSPEAAALAEKLVKLGWLTPFQAEQLLQERAHELLLGPFMILDRLGDGFGGQVYKARHLRMNRTVAMRIIRKELLADPEVVQRFYEEVQAASSLAHDNLVLAFDAGPVGETHFLTTQYVTGRDLERLVQQEGPLPVGRACTYIYQTALGLHHAFERNLNHGSLAPAKLIVTRSTSDSWNARSRTQNVEEPEAKQKPGVVKIVGVGLSRLSRGSEDELKSGRHFLAPEQLDAGQPIDIRTDIYALGGIFHYLLTGKPPPVPGADGQRAPLEPLGAEVPPTVGVIMERMLALLPDERLQSPVEVAAGLGDLIEVDSEATAVQAEFDSARAASAALDLPASPPAGRHSAPRWFYYASFTLSILVLSSVVAVGFYFRPREPAPAPTTKNAVPPEVLVQSGMHLLQARAKDPKEQTLQLWQDFARFRMQHAGTADASSAAQYLGRLPSPLDRLDGKSVPPVARAGLDKVTSDDLVGVLGGPVWRAPAHQIQFLAYRPDGKLLAGASRNAIVVWDTATGLPQRVLQHRSPVTELTFSADGKTLYSCALDHRIYVWEADPGKAPVTLDLGQELNTVARSPVGNLLAAAGAGGFIQLVSPADRKELGRLTGHQGRVIQVVFAPDGKLIASAGQDGTIRLWDVADKKELRQLPGHAGGAFAVCFAPKGDIVASGGVDEHVRWSTVEGMELKRLKHGSGPIRSVRFAPDGMALASACNDGTVKLWEAASGKELGVFTDPEGRPLADLAFAPDGRTLVASPEGPILCVWDLATKALKSTAVGHTHVVNGVAFAPDGLTLVSVSADRTWRQWDLFKSQDTRTIRGHAEALLAVANADTGRHFATASADKTSKIWDAASGKEQTVISGFKGPVRSVAFAPNGKTVAAGSEDQTIKIWDLGSQKERKAFRAHAQSVRSLAFMPDSVRLVSTSLDKTVKLWDLGTGKDLRTITGQTDEFLCVAVAPSGLALAAAGGTRAVLLYDAVTGTQTGKLPGHTTAVTALAYSIDDQYLVSAGFDGQLFVWKTSAKGVHKVWQLPGVILGVAIAPDSRHIAAAMSNGLIYLLRIGPPASAPSGRG